jgi:hypothetical protein
MWGSLTSDSSHAFQNSIHLNFPSEVAKISTTMNMCAALTRIGDLYLWNEDNGVFVCLFVCSFEITNNNEYMCCPYQNW